MHWLLTIMIPVIKCKYVSPLALPRTLYSLIYQAKKPTNLTNYLLHLWEPVPTRGCFNTSTTMFKLRENSDIVMEIQFRCIPSRILNHSIIKIVPLRSSSILSPILWDWQRFSLQWSSVSIKRGAYHSRLPFLVQSIKAVAQRRFWRCLCSVPLDLDGIFFAEFLSVVP